jgi:hypothetical protein
MESKKNSLIVYFKPNLTLIMIFFKEDRLQKCFLKI